MLIYHYDRETGVYRGSGVADPDPMELQLAREAVYAPLALAAGEAYAQACAAAHAAFDQATASPELTLGQLAAAEAARDAAIATSDGIRQAALADAMVAANAVQPAHWLIPANATATPPPAFGFDEEAVFADGAWSVRDATPEPEEEEGEPDLEELAAAIRTDRSRRILRVRWLIDRHRDEVALGRSTTLTAEDYGLVLQHVQDLRDVPEQDNFPLEVVWPELPEAITATGA